MVVLVDWVCGLVEEVGVVVSELMVEFGYLFEWFVGLVAYIDFVVVYLVLVFGFDLGLLLYVVDLCDVC